MDAEAVMANLQRFYDTIPKEGRRCMQDAIQEVKAVKTGTMLNSVRADEAGPVVQIHTSVVYDRFVEDGRRDVYPKGKANGGRDWLHWDDPGGPEVFTKHAGPVKPRHFAAITAKNILAYLASFK